MIAPHSQIRLLMLRKTGAFVNVWSASLSLARIQGIEYPAQRKAATERNACEQRPDHKVLAQRGLQAEYWKHSNLGQDGQGIANRDVGERFRERHPAGLHGTPSNIEALSHCCKTAESEI